MAPTVNDYRYAKAMVGAPRSPRRRRRSVVRRYSCIDYTHAPLPTSTGTYVYTRDHFTCLTLHPFVCARRGVAAETRRQPPYKVMSRSCCLVGEKDAAVAAEEAGLGFEMMAMVPIFDMLNHHHSPNCAWDFEGGALVIRAVRAISKGAELTIG